PAHGAGSLCGRALGSDPFTTVGQQRRFNWAAQIKDRGEFVKQMLTNLPDRPAYFNFDVGVNLRGASHLGELAPMHALTEEEVKEAVASGAVVIDTRGAPFFGAGHFPDSMNIGLASAMFSTWTGFFVPGDSQIVLVVSDAGGPSPLSAAAAIGAASRRAFCCVRVIPAWPMSWAGWARIRNRNARTGRPRT